MKCKSRPELDPILHPTEWQKLSPTTPSAVEDAE